MFTRLDQSVCRPEQYSVSEKLLTWSGVSWPLLVMVTVSLFAAGMLTSPSPVTDHEDPQIANIIYNGPLICFPFIPVCGYLADRFGRLLTLAIALGIATVLAGLSTFSPILFAVARDLFSPSIIVLSILIAYESIPLRWRLVSLFALSVVPRLGHTVLEVGLGMRESKLRDRLAGDFEMSLESNFKEVYDANEKIKRIVISSVLGWCFKLAVFLLWKGREVLLYTIRGNPEGIFDFVLNEKRDSGGEIPFTKKRFLENIKAASEPEIGLLETIKRASGPLTLVLIIAASVGASECLNASYGLAAVWAVFGQFVSMYMPSVFHTIVQVSVILIAVIVWRISHSDVRYISIVGMLIAAIGSIVLVSFPAKKVFSTMIDVDEPKMDWLTTGAGYVVACTGLPLVRVTLMVLVLDLYPTPFRGLGISILFSLLSFFKFLAVIICDEFPESQGVEIGLSVFISVACLAGFAALYVTRWFDQSLIAKDPEEDSKWLIGDAEVPLLA